MGFALPIFIQPNTAVSPSAKSEQESVICARATVDSRATIDRHVNLPDKSHMDGDQVL